MRQQLYKCATMLFADRGSLAQFAAAAGGGGGRGAADDDDDDDDLR